MKKIKLILFLCMALFAAAFVGTPVAHAQSAQWSATSAPVQATITGGPWTLSQGGTSTSGGAYDGPIPSCTPGNSHGGTALINPPTTVNIMNPYYFPFVVGSGQNVKGYFDYRPKEINEAIVAATSTNAGQSWTFEQMAEQLTAECPNSDSNTANDSPGGNPAGNDDGEGHATAISLGGATFLYTLDRRTPHADSDGLIVHQILPRGVNALNPLPANSPFMQPPNCSPNCPQPLAPTSNIIAGWNFNSDSNTSTTYTTISGTPSFKVNNGPAPSTNNVTTSNVPSASAIGMTNGYTYSTAAVSIPKTGGGTGYAVNDTGTIGSSTVQYTVSSVSGGVVTGVTIPQFGPGLGLVVGTTYPTTATTGTGTGLTLKVTGTTTTGSVNGDDVTGTTLSSDPLIVLANNALANANVAPNDNNAWRVRGVGTASGSGPGSVVGAANTGNGWSNSAPPCTQGAQFMVDTTGYNYIVLQFDWYTTNQGVRDLQVLYTTNGGATWTPVGTIQVSGGGSAFNNQITINFNALGITSAQNNPGFGVEMVSVYDPAYQGGVGYSAPGGNVCSASATGTYTAAVLDSTTNQPDVYNNNSGNWRFDEVSILGTASNTNPITSDPVVNTTGLVNPDGILAIVPNTYPIKVLYVSKTLNSDYVAPTSYPLCPPSIPNGNLNDDVEVVRIATTSNFINFTDITPFNAPAYATSLNLNTPQIQMLNGLSDPSTISYSGIRWVSPNGTLIKLSNGNWGLFFGGGNCLDGDSDAFHAIMYAESPDLMNWTVINGINNPIASIASVTATDPVTKSSVTIPAYAPVVGQSVGGGLYDWFSGRIYAPQAIVTSPSTVSLIFAGYNAGFQLGGSKRDLSSYRNIGQVNLQVTNGVTLP